MALERRRSAATALRGLVLIDLLDDKVAVFGVHLLAVDLDDAVIVAKAAQLRRRVRLDVADEAAVCVVGCVETVAVVVRPCEQVAETKLWWLV